ncbi:MAG: TraR/DksA family transcriptional regulator [Flavobacteriales bacterium]|nr:TraR/DksA family transcriptional regulator [Flavobacteriales bacterium]|tara:strand:+ start:318 stop:647 length:330 start_codon:yes stop_codon:yes gene_type:complete
MKKKELIVIKKKIESEIEKTSNSILEYKKLNRPISPDNAIGRVSRMDAINNKSVLDAALKKAEIKLQGLKMVEQKLETKDFGACIRCKKEIPLERLLLVPESHKCVNCA